jgi:hypothetical protein
MLRSMAKNTTEFLAEGLVTHQPALAIATPEHREGILAELRARDFDVDGMPDAALFTTATTSAIEPQGVFLPAPRPNLN